MTPLRRIVVAIIFLVVLSLTVTYTFPATSQLLDTRDKIVVWPLGDSITWGYGSSDGNGYRQNLLSLLNPLGLKVVYTGSMESGTLSSPKNEGHSFFEIAPLRDIATKYLRTIPCPHLTLLHIGTNDCIGNRNIPDAGARLGALLDDIDAICPDMPVIVAQIIGTSEPSTQKHIDDFNEQIPAVVEQSIHRPRNSAGDEAALSQQGEPSVQEQLRQQQKGGQGPRKYLLVDMSQALVHGDWDDWFHPNDIGFEKMAELWYDGIVEARARGWIGSGRGGVLEAPAPVPQE